MAETSLQKQFAALAEEVGPEKAAEQLADELRKSAEAAPKLGEAFKAAGLELTEKAESDKAEDEDDSQDAKAEGDKPEEDEEMADKDKEAKKAEAIDKSELPEPVREIVEKMESAQTELAKTNEDLRTRLEKTETDLQKERDARKLREYVSKAEAFATLGKPAEIGELLKTVDEHLPKEQADKVREVLQRGSELAKSAFDEVGSSAGGDSGTNQVIETKVAELRKSESGLTYEQAYTRVLEDNPELYKRQLAESSH